MISVRTLSVSAAIAAVLPLQALAAFASPGALVGAWLEDRSARDFAFEAHAQVEQYYFSLWAKGSYQGMWPEDGSAVETITFDMAAPAEGVKARVKADVILVDKVLYAKLVSAEGTVDQTMTELSASLKMKEWVAIPMEESLEAAGISMEEQKALVIKIYDALFTMTPGTEYQLTLKRDFLQRVMAVLAETDPYMLPMDASEVREAERMILRHLKMDMKLNVDLKDLSLGATVNGTFNLPEENVSTRFMLDTNRRKTPLVVKAPLKSVSIEEFVGSLDGSSFSGLEEFVPPMIPFGGGTDLWMPAEDDWSSDEEYDWNEDVWTEDESTSDTCSVNDRRKGLCGERPLRNR